jgi:DNA-binding transcriptional MerR regulator
MGGDVGKYVMSVAVMMTGVEAYRIRRYETVGLVMPSRTCGRQRLFSDTDINLIREIAGLELQGVNLKGVRLILEMKRSSGKHPTDDERTQS